MKVKTKVLENQKTKKRTETYILDKEFFSEAEYAVTDELTSLADVEDFEIQSLRISSIKEIASQTDGEHNFIATLEDIFTDDDGNEKKLKYKILLWADNLTQANHRVQELAKEGYDMIIEGIKQVDYKFLTE